MLCFLLYLSPEGDGLQLMLGNHAEDLIMALLTWFMIFDHITESVSLSILSASSKNELGS